MRDSFEHPDYYDDHEDDKLQEEYGIYLDECALLQDQEIMEYETWLQDEMATAYEGTYD
jgi:hypothetical protein